MAKIKCLIDFDGTLFNTKLLKVELFNIFKELGFSKKEIEESYKLINLDYQYSPIKHFAELRKFKNVSEVKFNDQLIDLYNKVNKFIFLDVNDFLNRINKNLFEVDILSLGDEEFQSKKIEHSGIKKYFDNVYITQLQKWKYLDNLVDLGEEFVFVDDRGDTVYEVARRFKKSFSVEINREKEPFDIMEPKKEYSNVEIKDFNELLKMLGANITAINPI